LETTVLPLELFSFSLAKQLHKFHPRWKAGGDKKTVSAMKSLFLSAYIENVTVSAMESLFLSAVSIMESLFLSTMKSMRSNPVG
jgi:hypothetical protein